MSYDIPTPEEMQMMETLRRLKNLGYAKETFPHLSNNKFNESPSIPIPEKKSDERKDIKTTEGAFPGEFSVMRVSR